MACLALAISRVHFLQPGSQLGEKPMNPAFFTGRISRNHDHLPVCSSAGFLVVCHGTFRQSLDIAISVMPRASSSNLVLPTLFNLMTASYFVRLRKSFYLGLGIGRTEGSSVRSFFILISVAYGIA